MKHFAIPRIKKMVERDHSTSRIPGAILPTETSPTRFVIPLEMMKLISTRDDLSMNLAIPVRRMMSILKNEEYSVESISKNPTPVRTETTESFVEEMEDFAKGLGIGSVGYTRLSENLIFQNMGVLYKNAIVLTMEMDSDKIELAPSPETGDMIMRTYDELGIATNKLADFLRSHGYGAQASHPIGGLVLYPPLAQSAGLGWLGLHGLLITPEFGPRVRFSAIFTSIENLPFSERSEHEWIEQYCKKCGRCMRECPTQAIFEEPLVEGHRITHIDREKCFPYFTQYYGCTICVKVCPFSRRSYDELRKRVKE